MKTNLSSLVICFFVSLIIVTTNTSILWSQQEESNEILVYVKPNTVYVTLDQKTNIKLTSETIKSPAFLQTLKLFKISEIKRTYANFNLSDTLRYSPEGEPIVMLDLSRLFKITVPSPYEPDSVVAAFSRLSNVIYAEKNGGWKLHTNDEHYTKQWYLKNTGQSDGTTGADIKIEDVWQIFTGSSQMKIGIIDSGIKTDHEDLSGKVSGENPDYNWHDPDWYYSYSHGTHVGGIAGAKTSNGLGIAGVDQNTQIYSRRIFDSQNHQNDDVFIYNAIVDAVNQGCMVLNNSWGRPYYSATIRYAFAYAYKMNRTSVVSMGNWNGSQTQYPAGFGQGIIAVGSTNDNDVVSVFSNIGNHIDVSAPGGSGTGDLHDIFSTVAYSTNYGYYDYLNGTSMAAPVVTGIASLLKGYNSNLYNDDIEHIIQLSADDKGDPGWDQYYGYGRVNAKTAIDLLRSPYVLQQSTSAGGTDVGSTDYYTTAIYGALGLATGVYIVKRHEIRKNVSYTSKQNVNVWGRGVATNGWSLESPNFAMGWCDVVPGTVTSTSATLRTYIYQVWTLNYDYLGYYPTTASNVTFAYTVHGIPAPLTAFISGPTYLTDGELGTWTANASGGNPPYSYAWSYYVYCNDIELEKAQSSSSEIIITPDAVPCGSWFTSSSTTNTFSRRGDGRSFKVKCVVTDANSSTYTATLEVSGGVALPKDQNTTKAAKEYKTELLANYPNPFNPSTRISYSLQKEGRVSLKIYNTLGQEVKTLVNEVKSAGIHSAEFDASNLPSGIYIYRMQSGEYVSTKKMLLIK